MAELGWFEGQRVELIDGEVVEQYRPKASHAAAIKRVREALADALGARHEIRAQLPLILGPTSEPQPDLVVVAAATKHAADEVPELIVEVSDTTLVYDRRRKASLYAEASVADYWIVNLADHQLEVYREPVPQKTQPFSFGYAKLRTLSVKSSVSPLSEPQTRIAVSDLLP
jgi:hypothetical protein